MSKSDIDTGQIFFTMQNIFPTVTTYVGGGTALVAGTLLYVVRTNTGKVDTHRSSYLEILALLTLQQN